MLLLGERMLQDCQEFLNYSSNLGFQIHLHPKFQQGLLLPLEHTSKE
jgi:hypothetical protein